MIMSLIGIILYVLTAIAFYRLAKIAGRPEIAWYAWVPILNQIQRLMLIKKSGWWVLMYLVPIANLILWIVWNVKLLHAFGKHGGYVLFMIFLNPVYAILWVVWGFSEDTRYTLGSSSTTYSYGKWGL